MGELYFNSSDQLHSIPELMTGWKGVRGPTFVRAFFNSTVVGSITEFKGPVAPPFVATGCILLQGKYMKQTLYMHNTTEYFEENKICIYLLIKNFK